MLPHVTEGVFVRAGDEIQQRPYRLGKPAKLFGRELIENIARERDELARQQGSPIRWCLSSRIGGAEKTA
jgi:hypothetical protein